MARWGGTVQDFSATLKVFGMSDLFVLQNRLIRTWFELIEVYIATVATVSARMPIIAAAASGFGDKRAHRETQVMVAEKLRAASEGAEAGALESAKVALRVLTGQNHPVAVAGHMIDVAAAATRPARRKVRANARRLTLSR
jgi:hypothetical protein